MKVLLKPTCLVLVPDDTAEADALAEWVREHEGRVFLSAATGGEGHRFLDLGPRSEACREPVQIASQIAEPAWRLISNFAQAPFELDGREYANVEAFWQGLKFPSESDRRRVASMSGPEARRAGEEKGYGESIEYEANRFVPGTWDHWQLMRRACFAKFSQNPEAAAALLSTGTRPLEHRMRRDSRTIPGVLMAAIWMEIRSRLASGDQG